MSQPNQPFGNPYASAWTATSEHYHAIRSLNQHGVIEHTRALAQQILKSGGAKDEWQALDAARAQVQAVRQVVRAQRLHQQARRELEAEATQRERRSDEARGALGSAV